MIGIGISTYNDFESTDRLIRSLKKFTKGEYGKDYAILVMDDGTGDGPIYSKLVDVCNNHGVYLLRNPVNKGIPYTWNRIVDFFNTDIIVIFNNDIIVVVDDWLKYLEYFLTNNEKIGTVGFPLINPPNFTIKGDSISWDSSIEHQWGQQPGRVGAPVGCCFGFKKEIWYKVINPDGSTGFWEDLVSFHEETHFGFKLSEMRYYNYMLTWPPMIHFGGQTFQRNANLIERPVDWSTWNRQEYIDTIMKSPIYPKEWKPHRIVWTGNSGAEMVDRMAYSRYMFSKHWNVLDSYDMPQVPIHKRVVDTLPYRNVKWIDKHNNDHETVG